MKGTISGKVPTVARMAATAAAFATVLALGSSTFAASKLVEKDKRKDFPKVSLPALNGKGTVNPTSMKGKVVIVDFWASWCEPCKVELPFLNSLYKKYKDKGLVVIGVNMDEKVEDAKAFLKDNPVQVPLAYDGAKQVLAKEKNIEKMPTSFILDKNGKEAVRHEAFHAGDEKAFEDHVVQLLKEK